jgi:hypothetical protein
LRETLVVPLNRIESQQHIAIQMLEMEPKSLSKYGKLEERAYAD